MGCMRDAQPQEPFLAARGTRYQLRGTLTRVTRYVVHRSRYGHRYEMRTACAPHLGAGRTLRTVRGKGLPAAFGLSPFAKHVAPTLVQSSAND